MTTTTVDLEKLRVALRRMSRDNMLIIAERAIESVPQAKLRAIVSGFIRLDDLTKTKDGAAPLLAEVRKFHEASMRGDFYEGFAVNSKNFMDQSEGTETFIAEFKRLIGKCMHAAKKGPQAPIREAFELLFKLLRRIDECNDDIIFFADEGGAWQVNVDWDTVFPVYFKSLAETVLPEEFARDVDQAIADFDSHDRSRHLTAARRVASAKQKAALRAFSAQNSRNTPKK